MGDLLFRSPMFMEGQMTPLQILGFAIIEAVLIILTVVSLMEERRQHKEVWKPQHNEPRWE